MMIFAVLVALLSQSMPVQPVVHELYDELVFHEPNESFYGRLMAGPQRQLPRHPLLDFFTPFPNPQEEQDVQKIMAAQRFVDDELQGTPGCSPTSFFRPHLIPSVFSRFAACSCQR